MKGIKNYCFYIVGVAAAVVGVVVACCFSVVAVTDKETTNNIN